MASAPAPAVGIDLGTTYSVVGVYKKTKPEIIANDSGKRTTPSYVAYTETDEYVGDAAKEIADCNTLFDSKRLIGRRYDDPHIQDDLKHWPFSVKNDGGMPKYEVNTDGNSRLLTPEEVSAKVLEAMKTTAEDSLETTISKAVVTVPAYFNDAQRAATKTAGEIAGLEVIGILNEPTAAAIAFGCGKVKNSTVLIYDLGGGTFDLTVLKVLGGDEYEILAHGGDTHLGGQDFDRLLLKEIIKDVERKEDIRLRSDEDPELFHELRTACEHAKRKLSTMPQATINVFLSRHGKGYKKDITRAYFEELCAAEFKKTIDLLPGVLKEAKVRMEDIQDVVLVGGSTRIPKVRATVQEFFGGKELNKSVNPDEAVALGATIYAASLTGHKGARKVVAREVTSLSLGVATSDGLTAFLIRRNSSLPCEVTKLFTTADNDQEEAEIRICQGERARAEDNNCLGSVDLNLPSMPKGEADIAVTFSLDLSGMLTVVAKERSSGVEEKLELSSEARLTAREIEDIIAKAKQFRLEDDEVRNQARRNHYNI